MLQALYIENGQCSSYAIDFTAMTQTAHHGIKNKRALRIQANQNTVESTSIASTTFLCMARFGSMICPRTHSFLICTDHAFDGQVRMLRKSFSASTREARVGP